MIEEMARLQQFYPIDPIKKTLVDFNRVQTRFEKDKRQDDLRRLAENPSELTQNIVNTIFGFILRKEDIKDYVADLEQVIPG